MSDLWQEGGYRGKLVRDKVEISEATTGSAQMKLPYDILHANGEPSGQIRTVYLYLTDRALTSWVGELLQSMGYNGDVENPEFADHAYEPADLYCKHEMYEGKLREKWAHSKGSKPVSDPGSLAKKFRALGFGAGASKPPASPPPAASGPPAAPPPVEENVSSVKTRDEAWARFTEFGGDAGSWVTTVTKVSKDTGKAESEFGPKEWQTVAAGGIPF